jgi:hypothetical protein
MKQQLYQTMVSIQTKYPGETPLKELNLQCLRSLRDDFFANNNIVPSQKPTIKTLNRDQDVYGNREIISNPLQPQMSPSNKELTTQHFDIMMNERNKKKEDTPYLPVLTSIKEDPASTEDLLAKMQMYETTRLTDSIAIQSEHGDPAKHDPKAIFAQFDSELTKKTGNELEVPTSSTTLIPANTITRSVHRYLMLSGFERQWDQFPYRYSFTLDTDTLSSTLKNITELRLTKLIIPMQGRGKPDAGNTANLSIPSTINQYGLNVPYLVVVIDQINSVYHSISLKSRPLNSLFVFDKFFSSDNGRGYILLKPCQDEVTSFYPTPLSSLPKLTLSILKPNGMLYNMSSDKLSITSLIYSPLEANRLYIRLVTKQYFDRNELTVGDNILVRGFTLPSVQEFADNLFSTHGSSVSQQDKDTYLIGKKHLEDFMNRQEGHEVQATGISSINSTLTREFAIFIPRILNDLTGSFEIDRDISGTLNTYLGNTANDVYTNFDKINLQDEAKLLNMSLQVSLSATVTTAASDLSGLHVKIT